MNNDRLITLAIHTYNRAQFLKTILENEGISVTLQNVNLENPVVSSGIRVRIFESDLPLALRIVENIELFTSDGKTDSNTTHQILVPVDFSPHSVIAADYAFHFAEKHNASIVILHTYLDPVTLGSNLQLTDTLTFDDSEAAMEQAEVDSIIDHEAEKQMERFVKQLREKVKSGEIPPVKFRTEIREGVPEDVIAEMASEIHPILIVMGTRGAGKKERELVGSVTAEVLDTCRFSVFTVPESTSVDKLKNISEVLLLSSLDQEDILALDTLYRLFPLAQFNVTLVSMPSRKHPDGDPDAQHSLIEYCRRHYEGFTFNSDSVKKDTLVNDFERICSALSPQLIVVPNRKKNIFARLFNPGIAHKLLFHTDVPMMVIPV